MIPESYIAMSAAAYPVPHPRSVRAPDTDYELSRLSFLHGRTRTLEALRLAYEQAVRSPDPRTQNGAVILLQDQVIAGGYNNFPVGVVKWPKRDWVVHAEVDAILGAGDWVYGSTLVCPWVACPSCALIIARAGVAKVIGHRDYGYRAPSHWDEQVAVGLQILERAGIPVEWHEGPVPGAPAVLVDGEKFDPKGTL